MLKIVLSLGLLATIASADMPEECKTLPISKVRPCECCDMPKMFSEEDAKSCGFMTDANVSMDLKTALDLSSCEKEACVMKKLNILTADNKVDKEAAKKLLDKVTAADPDFTDFIDETKSMCIDRDLAGIGPAGVCEPKKTLYCILHHTISKCPKWKEVDDCIELRQRVEKCRQHFVNI